MTRRLEVEATPEEVGFDSARLRRIDAHFQRYVDDGLLPGWLVAVTRHGKVAHVGTYGHRDVASGAPIEPDTLFRLYSMTKPVTSLAAMMLYEEGAFELKTPVYRFIPSFRDVRVYRSGSSVNPVTEPAVEPVRMWHLLTHTAGLTYGFHYAHPCDALYRAAGYEWGAPDVDLQGACDAWASIPLLFQPGSEWNYSVSTDVLGRVVEVLSGLTLDEFFSSRILGPLGMTDTGFALVEGGRPRLATLYMPNPADHRRAVPLPGGMGDVTDSPPKFLSGGGGLVGTAADYLRFCELLRRGGELDGVRLVGPRTLRYMTSNHLPGGVDLEAIGRPLFAETTFNGVGFGLGFSVVIDPVKNKVPGSVGEFSWGGAASTTFFVDPAEDMTAIFLTQLLPSSTWPIRSELKQLVHQALVDG